MKANRTLEICHELAVASSKLRCCQKLVGELKLSQNEIKSTEIGPWADKGEVGEQGRRVIKAVYTRLRHQVYKIAFEKGIVAIGKPLPNVGFWKGNQLLVSFGESGMFVVSQGEGRKSKKIHLDPLANLEFLALLQ